MGILDDAIREHLDLKRKHGARDAELREIADEALGSGERPDPFAPGELFSESSSEVPATEGDVPGPLTPPPDVEESPMAAEEPTRLVETESPDTGATESPDAGGIEAPGAEGIDLGPADEPLSPPEGRQQVPGQEQFEEPIPGQQSLDEPSDLDGPSEGEAPPVDTWSSMPDVEPPAPSESLEELISEEEPFPEDAAAPREAPEPPPPPEEELLAEEPAPEPESSVPDPPPPPPESGPEPLGRARGRVDVPTQEHPPPGETGGLPPLPDYEPEHDVAAPADEAPPVGEPPSTDEPLPPDEPPPADEPEASSSGPQLYDFESDDDPAGGPSVAPEDTDDDFEALGPETDEHPYVPEEEPFTEERPPPSEGILEDEDAYSGGSLEAEEAHEEESEGDDLWFEKGPPKDFDFEDD